MSIDTRRIINFTISINSILTTPFQLAISLILLWQQLGIATLGGISIMIILIPLNGFITSKIRETFVSLMKAKDKRVKLINEILNGIKVLKLYAWESSFEKKIKEFREGEVKSLNHQAYWSSGFTFFFIGSTFFVSK